MKKVIQEMVLMICCFIAGGALTFSGEDNSAPPTNSGSVNLVGLKWSTIREWPGYARVDPIDLDRGGPRITLAERNGHLKRVKAGLTPLLSETALTLSTELAAWPVVGGTWRNVVQAKFSGTGKGSAEVWLNPEGGLHAKVVTELDLAAAETSDLEQLARKVLAGIWGGEKPGQKPNIVFILADDAGYGDFGFTGHPYAKTPAIDKLASQGTFFKNFYVGGATCCPSRTSLMTGRYTASFPKYPAQYGLGKAVTITELLHRLGYRTGHFGKWHLGPEQGNGTYGIDDIKVSGGNRKDPRGRDAKITDQVIEFLRANKDKPFYVNVWFHTPHNPVNPPQHFVDRFKNIVVNPADFKSYYMEQYLTELQKSGEDINAGMRKRLGDLAQMDEQVFRILKAIDDLGLAENTIVVFTSDNGPNVYGFAGIFRGRKHSLYDGGVHMPLLVRWPGHVKAGRIDAKSVLAGVDFLPTLCGLTGAKFDSKEIAGEDVSDIWLGKERERQKDLFWRTSNPRAPAVILRRTWKLHQGRKGPSELYDLAKDPGEQTNVAAQNPAVVHELSEAINRWRATLPKTYIGSEKDTKD